MTKCYDNSDDDDSDDSDEGKDDDDDNLSPRSFCNCSKVNISMQRVSFPVASA